MPLNRRSCSAGSKALVVSASMACVMTSSPTRYQIDELIHLLDADADQTAFRRCGGLRARLLFGFARRSGCGGCSGRGYAGGGSLRKRGGFGRRRIRFGLLGRRRCRRVLCLDCGRRLQRVLGVLGCLCRRGRRFFTGVRWCVSATDADLRFVDEEAAHGHDVVGADVRVEPQHELGASVLCSPTMLPRFLNSLQSESPGPSRPP